jgi:hypothetical protein
VVKFAVGSRSELLISLYIKRFLERFGSFFSAFLAIFLGFSGRFGATQPARIKPLMPII